MKKITLLLSIILLTISCERDELPIVEENGQNISLDKSLQSEFSNWELIQDELKIYEESKSMTRNFETYFCSEDMGYGTYNVLPYLNSGYYINAFLLPT